MQIKIFNVPITDNGEMLAEMNKFLATHKVLETIQNFYQNGNDACWCFCVKYLSTQFEPNNMTSSVTKSKIDYKTILSEEEFAVFLKLRVFRKEIAAEMAIPAFAVFTDEELSEMAKLPKLETGKLISIKGIGEKKVEKFGGKLLELYYKRESELQKIEEITGDKEIG